MSEAVVDDIVAVLPPLLQSLEALGFIARRLNPPDFGQVMQAAGTPDIALQSVRSRLTDWPAEFADVRTAIETASDNANAALNAITSCAMTFQFSAVASGIISDPPSARRLRRATRRCG